MYVTLCILTITHQMIMKQVTTLTRMAAKKPMKNRYVVPTKLLSSSVAIETVNSCPSTVIVGLSSLASDASNVSIRVEAMTEPSSEAWAMVEEKVTVPLEQEEVEV